MSKSVLVIDTPEHCIHCPLLNGEDECMVQDKDANLNAGDSWDKLIKGCPLKPLPEKKEYIVPIDNVESQKDIIAVGWNACINEITGGNADD